MFRGTPAGRPGRGRSKISAEIYDVPGKHGYLRGQNNDCTVA